MQPEHQYMSGDLSEDLDDLLAILEDGYKAFDQASRRLADTNMEMAAMTMRDLSAQRRGFSDTIREFTTNHGIELKESGTIRGAFQRGWMALADAITGDDPYAVLAVAEEEEDRAVAEYRSILERDDLGDLRPVIQSQAGQVFEAHDRVRELRDAARANR